jgi:transcription elongation GreA/GreB family factor
MKPITKKGLEKLKNNIEILKELRLDFLKKKEDSFTQGSDLSENAEYIFATEEMYKIEKKINEIEQEIMKSKIIDYSTFPADSVKFGLTVTLVSDEQEDRIFKIVAFFVFKIFANESLGLPSSFCPIATIKSAGFEEIGIKYENGAAFKTPSSSVTIQAIGLGITVPDIILYLFKSSISL